MQGNHVPGVFPSSLRCASLRPAPVETTRGTRQLQGNQVPGLFPSSQPERRRRGAERPSLDEKRLIGERRSLHCASLRPAPVETTRGARHLR